GLTTHDLSSHLVVGTQPRPRNFVRVAAQRRPATNIGRNTNGGKMQVGVPAEIKDNEFRVAITPAGVHTLAQRGHDVAIEKSAGVGAGYLDDDYREAGATI